MERPRYRHGSAPLPPEPAPSGEAARPPPAAAPAPCAAPVVARGESRSTENRSHLRRRTSQSKSGSMACALAVGQSTHEGSDPDEAVPPTEPLIHGGQSIHEGSDRLMGRVEERHRRPLPAWGSGRMRVCSDSQLAWPLPRRGELTQTATDHHSVGAAARTAWEPTSTRSLPQALPRAALATRGVGARQRWRHPVERAATLTAWGTDAARRRRDKRRCGSSHRPGSRRPGRASPSISAGVLSPGEPTPTGGDTARARRQLARRACAAG